MAEKLTQNTLMKALNWAYDSSVEGLPFQKSAAELAWDYSQYSPDKIKNANKLIGWQTSKAGASGFITGLGGLITLPVAVPANIASVLYLQIRMIAAIALMGSYNLNQDQVRAFVYLSLVGNEIKDIAKNVGIQLGQKMTKTAIQRIPRETIMEINQKVGFRLLTKLREKGVINLGKAIPLIGGMVGGTFDAVTTHSIGKIAIKTFLNGQNDINPKKGERHANLFT